MAWWTDPTQGYSQQFGTVAHLPAVGPRVGASRPAVAPGMGRR